MSAATATATATATDDDIDILLPSQFLTLADILSDFSAVSTSPQSTLLGCNNDHAADKQNDVATLELLSKAAGEVAKMTKAFKSVQSSSTNYGGTGFFDCTNSVKLLKCPPVSSPPSLPPPDRNTVHFPPQSPFCSQHYPQFRHFSPHMMLGQVQLPKPQQQKKATKKNNDDAKTNKNNGNNRPLGLPPSAWPPLPGQAQAQPTAAATLVGPPRDSVGTGVFLPRRVTTTPEDHKNKSEVNGLKAAKNNKSSQRRDSLPIKSTDGEIALPSEWVY